MQNQTGFIAPDAGYGIALGGVLIVSMLILMSEPPKRRKGKRKR